MAGLQFQGFASAVSLVAQGEFSAALQAIKNGIAKAKAVHDGIKTLQDQIWAAGENMDARFGRGPEDAAADAGQKAGKTFVANFAEAAKSGGGAIRKALDPIQQEVDRIFDQTRTPLENYERTIARLNELRGRLGPDTYSRAVIQAQEAFEQASRSAEKGLTDIQKASEGLGRSFGSALSGLIKGTTSLRDVLADVLSSIAQVISSNITNVFGKTGGGGGFFASMLSGLLSFDGGGFTGMGSRVGGVDGKGGFPAILHPNETVVDHRRMLNGSTQGVHVTVGVSSDGNGNIMPFVQSVARQEAGKATSSLAGTSRPWSIPGRPNGN